MWRKKRSCSRSEACTIEMSTISWPLLATMESKSKYSVEIVIEWLRDIFIATDCTDSSLVLITFCSSNISTSSVGAQSADRCLLSYCRALLRHFSMNKFKLHLESLRYHQKIQTEVWSEIYTFTLYFRGFRSASFMYWSSQYFMDKISMMNMIWSMRKRFEAGSLQLFGLYHSAELILWPWLFISPAT